MMGRYIEPIEDVLEHGRSALLFEPLDEAGLAAALERMLTSPRLRARFAKLARALLEDRHTWRHNAAQILQAAGYAPRSDEAKAEPELRRAS